MPESSNYGNYAAAAANTGLGLYQYFDSRKKLKELIAQGVPQFGEDAAMRDARLLANNEARYGFSPEQKAAAEQGRSRVNNTRYNRAINLAGGNLAGAINAGVNYSNVGAVNEFAAKDAALQQQKQRYANTFAQNLQSLKNQNSSNAYNYHNQAEQALGHAQQAGLNNIVAGAAYASTSYGNGNRQARYGANSGGDRYGTNYYFPRDGYGDTVPGDGYNYG